MSMRRCASRERQACNGTAYQAENWCTGAVVFIEITADVDFDSERKTRTKVA